MKYKIQNGFCMQNNKACLILKCTKIEQMSNYKIKKEV